MSIFIIIRYVVLSFFGILVFFAFYLLVKDKNFEKYIDKIILGRDSSIELKNKTYYDNYFIILFIVIGILGIIEIVNDFL